MAARTEREGTIAEICKNSFLLGEVMSTVEKKMLLPILFAIDHRVCLHYFCARIVTR